MQQRLFCDAAWACTEVLRACDCNASTAADAHAATRAKALFWRAAAHEADGTRAGLQSAARDAAAAAVLAPRDAKARAARSIRRIAACSCGLRSQVREASVRLAAAAAKSRAGEKAAAAAAISSGALYKEPPVLAASIRKQIQARRVKFARYAVYCFLALRFLFQVRTILKRASHPTLQHAAEL